MKKQLILLFALVASIVLTSCGNTALPEVSEEPSAPTSSVSEMPSEDTSKSTEVSEPVSSSQEPTESSDKEEIGGPNLQCQEHTFSYHAVPGELVDLIGNDPGMEWYNTFFEASDPYGRPGEGFTIVAFVEHFQVSREDFTRCIYENLTQEFVESIGMTMDEYLEEFGYTDEQIDAIYSGDQKEINRAFCGPLAVYNENDGELYSIYWMAEHTAEDYIAAGLSLDQVQKVVELSQSTEPKADYSLWSHYGKAVEPILEQAEAIEASADAKE